MLLRAALGSAALVGLAGAAQAIVVRHDAPPSLYRTDASAFPALADLPGSGHGVLIAPQWVVTAAHAVAGWGDELESVSLGGRERAVAKVIVHPGFASPPPPGPDGDLGPTMAASFAMRDIALIRLAEPVTDIAPAAIEWGPLEPGETVRILGKGRGGTGLTGELRFMDQRGTLRTARNTISDLRPEWVGYRFDAGDDALPDEGMIGAGDSGGPVLVERDGEWRLAALASWKYWDGALEDYRPGAYGLTSYHARLGFYREWIDRQMAGG